MSGNFQNFQRAEIDHQRQEALRTDTADSVFNVAVEEGTESAARAWQETLRGHGIVTDHEEKELVEPRPAAPPRHYHTTEANGSAYYQQAPQVPGPFEELTQQRFKEEEQSVLDEIERNMRELKEELARGNSAGRGASAESDAVIEADLDALYQNLFTYAAIGLAIVALATLTTDRTFIQLITVWLVVFWFVVYAKGYITSVQAQHARDVAAAARAGSKRVLAPPGRTLLITASTLTAVFFGLIVFAIVTVATSRINPVLRENGLVLTAFFRLAAIPALIIGTRPVKQRGKKNFFFVTFPLILCSDACRIPRASLV